MEHSPFPLVVRPADNALTLGPTDRAQDLGVLGTPAQRQVLDNHRRRLVEAARKYGKAVAMLTDSAEGMRQMSALGASLELRGLPAQRAAGTPVRFSAAAAAASAFLKSASVKP